MKASGIITQLRTTDLEASIDFYVNQIGFELDFRFGDFYAGIKVADAQLFHLKLVDEKDPSIGFVQSGDHFHLFFPIEDANAVADQFKRNKVHFHAGVTETDWGTREFYVLDDQGHVLCFSQSLADQVSSD